MTCRTMGPSEAVEVAALHRSVFPDYESSRLGAAFCQRLMEAYSRRTDAFVLVTGGGGSPITGYLVGCPPRVQRDVNDELAGWGALAYLGAAVRSPKKVAAGFGSAWRRARRVVGQKIRRQGGGRRAADADVATEPPSIESDARVVLIGVAESSRGAGIADELLTGFADRARDWGWRRADLLVEAANGSARRAYERNGWLLESPVAGDGSCRYWLELASPAGRDLGTEADVDESG